MHYLGNKYRQNTIAKIVLVGTSDTIVAAQYKGKVLTATIFLGIYLLAVSAFTYLVMRKTTKKWVTITYTVLLFICLGIFGGIAYVGPTVRDETAQEFYTQCKPENITSDLKKIDALYVTANSQLCTVACPCDADSKDWKNYQSSALVLQNLLPTQSKEVVTQQIAQKTLSNVLMITDDKGADKYPECKAVDVTLKAFMAANFNNSAYTLQQGLDLLDAVEDDFECASMCSTSRYFAFSKVGHGPPSQNCTSGINKVMNKAASITFWSGLIFGIITFVGIVLSFLLIFRKKHDNEEPLLNH
ncbi:tetraspanin family protein [Stylonychia lemnae]|uniref:Tetraspanin family protein n=1 Tax=Stylonychia lemnae TaxID=5949 RepID=A0A077ZSY8_STYLE|nr:tetraspanin family protein [Stylonychia lemnae]|eukprot:CDW72425.1 tetraspanin family protein [Stylonychia lemnae]